MRKEGAPSRGREYRNSKENVTYFVCSVNLPIKEFLIPVRASDFLNYTFYIYNFTCKVFISYRIYDKTYTRKRIF